MIWRDIDLLAPSVWRERGDQAEGIILAYRDRRFRDRFVAACRLVAGAAKVLLGRHHDEADELERIVEPTGEPHHQVRLHGFEHRLPSLQNPHFHFVPMFHWPSSEKRSSYHRERG